MKKIVFIIEQLYGGGAERVTSQLASAICNIYKYEVHVITFSFDLSKEYQLDSNVKRHNITIQNKNKLTRNIQKFFKLRKCINNISPDYVVSLAMTKTIGILACSLLFTKYPLILSERNDPNRYKNNKILRLIRYLAFCMSDGIVFQTNMAKEYFSKNIQKKGTVIYNPINNQLPDVYIGEKEKMIVNFCSLTKQKNLDLLIESFSNIKEEFPLYNLYIYGEGGERKRLEDKILFLKLENRVFLPGYSENIYDIVKKAELFVSSSDFEGVSNSMLEALALGIPSICTDCPIGGAKEFINGVNGMLVPVGDEKTMSQAIRYILTEKESSNKMIVEANKIRQKLSIEVVTKQWIEFIESIG